MKKAINYKMKLSTKVEKNGFIAYIFTANLGIQGSVTQSVVVHPTRGYITPTLVSERLKVVDFVFRDECDNLDNIMGLPMLSHESAYKNTPDKLAEKIALRGLNVRMGNN